MGSANDYVKSEENNIYVDFVFLVVCVSNDVE